MRTISGSGSDIRFEVVDGLESVRQRVQQHLRIRLGEYFLNSRAGLPDLRILGQRRQEALAIQIIRDHILEVEDVTGVRNVVVSFDPRTRELSYSANVDTIYGVMEV